MFRLDEKVALVTGAGSGIGASIAETFAAAGAQVFVADRDEKAGRQVTEKIRGTGQAAEFIALDVTSEAQCEQVRALVHGKFSRLDVLVNNAGIGHVGTLLQTTGADMDRIYSVNVRGMFNVTK